MRLVFDFSWWLVGGGDGDGQKALFSFKKREKISVYLVIVYTKCHLF